MVKRRKGLRVMLALLAMCALAGCSDGEVPSEKDTSPSQQEVQQQPETSTAPETEEEEEETVLNISVGGYEFQAAWEDNPSAQEFKELLAQGPITISMQDYGGFEKVGPLGTEITPSDQSITTEPGDVILYQGDQITIYYGTNSWNFTRLAKIQNVEHLKEALGKESVQVTFSLGEK